MEGKRKKAIACLLLSEFGCVVDECDRVAKWKKRRNWIKLREHKGYFANIISEVGIEDAGSFAELMRMSRKGFGL